MTKSFDFDEFKKKAAETGQTLQKKLNYLSESVSRSGMEGVTHWLKSHHQIDDLKAAINDLLAASEEETFTLLQVHTTFSSFVLPEEDSGQAEWYQTADSYLKNFEKSLVEDKVFNVKALQSALNELKFISQSTDFHQRYKIETIQEKVTQLYQTLQQALKDYKAIEKEKLSTKQDDDKLKAAELETRRAEAEAKKVMLENVKIKEKRLTILEEKKRRIAEKELLEKQAEQQLKDSEIQAKQAEVDRQAKLQDAYVDLQLEEKLARWEVNDYVNKLRNKLEKDDLTEADKATLSELTEYLNNLD
ncbi:hypothetical protein [Aliikangiella coralliicola]|uniref:Uncharacterized protein n=1 Tax=Aliikangiella coralliicola TaxID=2592383 RepID=A0A545UFA0_9GAMM|nr:hypothetical protein [Aliikangiella coralliicola]TQV88151.1 hypothetical protein FLL46_06380 [Aliikangiella coralliicola]